MNPLLNNSIFALINSLKSGNPNIIFNQMMNNNPSFRSFIEQNKGKSPDQVAKENGIDISQFMKML